MLQSEPLVQELREVQLQGLEAVGEDHSQPLGIVKNVTEVIVNLSKGWVRATQRGQSGSHLKPEYPAVLDLPRPLLGTSSSSHSLLSGLLVSFNFKINFQIL